MVWGCQDGMGECMEGQIGGQSDPGVLRTRHQGPLDSTTVNFEAENPNDINVSIQRGAEVCREPELPQITFRRKTQMTQMCEFIAVQKFAANLNYPKLLNSKKIIGTNVMHFALCKDPQSRRWDSPR